VYLLLKINLKMYWYSTCALVEARNSELLL